MGWPTPQDFNEAVQNPRLNFADPELKVGHAQLNTLGLPQANTGAFASVYRLHCSNRDVALRCFLRGIEDRHKRYLHLSNFIRQANCQYTVAFDFLLDGIHLRGNWYPVLKMDWVKGDNLESYVAKNVQNARAIDTLAVRFAEMVRTLSGLHIAHGDLQHGNIMVHQGELRLVDYDGMFVPALAGMQSHEIGHPNYQHPGRNKYQFDETLDHFSSWVIHDSLRILSLAPELTKRVKAFEECLLFRHADYANPSKSLAFALIDVHDSEEVRTLGRRLRSLCQLAPNAVPPLGLEVTLNDPPAIDGQGIIEASYHHESLAPENVTAAMVAIPSDSSQAARTDPHWPTAQEYINVAHLPHECFEDPELVDSKAVYNAGGLRRAQGKDGIVFCVRPNAKRSKNLAVKCFFHADPSRDERYAQVAAYLSSFPWHFYDHLIEIEYLKKGIRVGDVWYPVVKMAWIDGESLDQFIAHARPNKHLFLAILNQWRELMVSMKSAGIAHGDLCPENILIHDGRLKLIDYDSFFVPSFKNTRYKPAFSCNDDLKHPRWEGDLNPKMDNFAAWLIDTALLTMAYDPGVWDLVCNPKGRLLFQSSDIRTPNESKLFAMLHHNDYETLRARAALLFRYIWMKPTDIPGLIRQNLALVSKEITPQGRALAHRKSKLAGTAVFCSVLIMALLALGPLIGSSAWVIGLFACLWTTFDVYMAWRGPDNP